MFISALHGLGVNDLLDKIKDLLTLVIQKMIIPRQIVKSMS